MNVSPNQVDASSAPFSRGTGDVVDRMEGNLSNQANSSDDNMKKTSGQDSDLSKLPVDLKKIQPDSGMLKGSEGGDKDVVAKKKRSRKKWKKPRDKPNRPLSGTYIL